jgi:chitinase
MNPQLTWLPLPPSPSDTSYPGGTTFQGTGIQFSSDPSVVKGAIALLKQRNPATKVLIAVGGATYSNWGQVGPNGVLCGWVRGQALMLPVRMSLA